MINRTGIRLQGIDVGSRDMFAAMNRAVALAKLRPAIDRVFPFDEAKQAYAHQASGRHFLSSFARLRRRGWQRNSGLPEFRTIKCRKSGKPDLR
jgi:hypothetical protein